MDKSGSYDLIIEYEGLDPLRTLRRANLAGLAIFLFLIPLDLWRLRRGLKDLSKTPPDAKS
ncbi:hypothetical protein HKBW3S43_01935 [Candidatus Hakubella thermalkaliphila]|nr:hypothetical protein [Candidatus Hakubella thermalkaliphila]GFP36148.1 hypothetical protein HKBW3S43_01935 [Candidatus Hakubella thermalkaliphila]